MMNPLVRISYFLHFFRGDIRLTENVLKGIHQKTALNHIKYHLDNIIVIKKVPSYHKEYTRSWIVRRLFDLFKTHKVRIIDPQKDIVFMDDEKDPENYHSIVIIYDGFSHLRENDQVMDPTDEDNDNYIELLYSQTDDEGGAADALEAEKAKKAEERRKAENPEEWQCSICTCFNPIGNTVCEVCGTGNRPPMEEIIAAKKAELAAAAGTQIPDSEQSKEKTPLHKTRLKLLSRDIRHIISHA